MLRPRGAALSIWNQERCPFRIPLFEWVSCMSVCRRLKSLFNLGLNRRGFWLQFSAGALDAPIYK